MIHFHENMWVENIERRNVVTPTEYLLLGSSLKKKVILLKNQNEYFEQKKQRELLLKAQKTGLFPANRFS